jgi:glycosyltransferase involved in cell wall biosynthesis
LSAKSAAATRSEVELLFVDDASEVPGDNGKVKGWRGVLRTARQVLGVDVFWRSRGRNVDVAVFSLWKTAILLVLWRVFRRAPAVFFVHSARAAHSVDRVLTSIALRLANGILCDSVETRERRIPHRLRSRTRVVSLLTEPVGEPTPFSERSLHSFIFWGRLAPEKRLDRAISVFSQIHRLEPRVRLTIVGPDAGELSRCRELIASLGLAHAVSMVGPLGREAIFERAQRVAFFLQTSDFEGFCKSAVEAMQHGVVPAVTPVGDVGRYCRHLTNSVHLLNEQQFVSDLVRLVASPEETKRLSENAQKTWSNCPIYSDDFVKQTRSLVGI